MCNEAMPIHNKPNRLGEISKGTAAKTIAQTLMRQTITQTVNCTAIKAEDIYFTPAKKKKKKNLYLLFSKILKGVFGA